ncbi:hypothetical protein SAMN03080598_04103 [Algoriphagus boritolerans DSM 17298 = JCM 18970]|uniref:Uncharacterized protein n=1 Tax=Algoriphagus boritolerans DSM 17298 = JCM 18970 TaxID=1120964 RepID=A0A1H6AHB2_9BACT|nr:hypothetical protein SAMN03080598_04103 [Algoriphagus boritolerans DSM 17298 = JCM 18970]
MGRPMARERFIPRTNFYYGGKESLRNAPRFLAESRRVGLEST